MNLVSVWEGMMAVDGYDSDPENPTNQPVSAEPTSDILVWSGIMFDHRMPLVHIDGRSTAECYITQVMEPIVLLLSLGTPNMVFQQDNYRPPVTRRTLNLNGFDILPSLVNSPDLKPVEYLWNFIVRDMNLRILAQTWMICAQQ
ncbi:transposable element Tcb1 transposase [Trichonephila clavipes]|nr:transposable element Tcb1 transposase [Trichonephila clavipes]